MRLIRAALIGILSCSAPATLCAQVGRIGPEFQVNTYTTRSQSLPTACRDGAGNFVVAWHSFVQDGNGLGVFAQRFTRDGAALGTEFQVNTYTTAGQYTPALCCAESGSFVVVWTSRSQDGENGGVFGQRFASGAVREGTEFQVNTYTTNSQVQPAVCCDPAGAFVVAWSSIQDGDGNGVFGQRFSSIGIPQGTEFQVNTITIDLQDHPAISCDTAGNFVAVWESQDQDGDRDGLFARRFDRDTMPVGTEFQVNTYTTSDQREPSVSGDAAGNFVVAWNSRQDGSGYGVLAQRFTSGGAPWGNEFLVNTYTPMSQRAPAVCVEPGGDFTVAWESFSQDGNAAGVFGQRFNAVGSSVGSEFPINSYTTANQMNPVIACGAGGNFLVAWTSDPANDAQGGATVEGAGVGSGAGEPITGIGQDGSEAGVFAQLFGAHRPAVAPALGTVGLGVTGVGLLLTGAALIGVRRRRKG